MGKIIQKTRRKVAEMTSINSLKDSIFVLRERLDKEYMDSRRAELRREIAVLEEQLAAERRVLEERQGELFS
ncbi:hypothetical protein L2W58_08150 [Dethiosulfovibrio sp. F2B]|uniref:hypothetical protein n=1 Tax=Dethiosulfovibrio faecalis TaxID=2720018 RepID=UPI001F18E6A0|nr:hypothetical protein [Dethiosulfovibrio faecalis]MCF4151773.1 hypothetical protein [Dethiosulfovibrio faecalis]